MATVPDPAWQQLCTRALTDAVATGGTNGRTAWLSFRDQQSSQPKRIVIADADFTNKGLEGYDLSRCWIGRTSFAGANLTSTSFTQSIFRDCVATGANIEAANFRDADMTGAGLSLDNARFDSNTLFEVRQDKLPDIIHPGLRLAAGRARSERQWRYKKSQSRTVRVLLWLTQNGFSFDRLAYVGLSIVVIFAIIFCVGGVAPTDALIASLKYFLSLNDTLSGKVLSTIGALEALIGMLFFAVFTTILVSMFFEKN